MEGVAATARLPAPPSQPPAFVGVHTKDGKRGGGEGGERMKEKDQGAMSHLVTAISRVACCPLPTER